MIQIYCGEGKGKTTAAVGLSVRASGAGMRVLFLQFLKNGNSSEIAQLEKLGVTVVYAGCNKFTFQMNDEEKAQTLARHNELLHMALEAIETKGADLIVLDEIIGTVSAGMADETLLRQVLNAASAETELVLTGRDPSAYMLEAADYISRIGAERHPFEKGAAPRKGIEF